MRKVKNFDSKHLKVQILKNLPLNIKEAASFFLSSSFNRTALSSSCNHHAIIKRFNANINLRIFVNNDIGGER